MIQSKVRLRTAVSDNTAISKLQQQFDQKFLELSEQIENSNTSTPETNIIGCSIDTSKLTQPNGTVLKSMTLGLLNIRVVMSETSGIAYIKAYTTDGSAGSYTEIGPYQVSSAPFNSGNNLSATSVAGRKYVIALNDGCYYAATGGYAATANKQAGYGVIVMRGKNQ